MGTIERNPASHEPIDFVFRKRRNEKERRIAENPQVYVMNFLNWAFDATKRTGRLQETPNDFSSVFNNGRVRGELVYERTISDAD